MKIEKLKKIIQIAKQENPCDVIKLLDNITTIDEFEKIDEEHKCINWFCQRFIDKKYYDKEILEYMSQNARRAFCYAFFVNGGRRRDGKRWEKGEDAISKDAFYSYLYAVKVVKGRWEKGEDAISKDAFYSYDYSRTLNIRFEKGENAIAKNVRLAYLYARDILKGRFKKCEKYICKNPYYALNYAKIIIKGPWPEAEEIIKTNKNYYAWYQEFIKKWKKENTLYIEDIRKLFEIAKTQKPCYSSIDNLNKIKRVRDYIRLDKRYGYTSWFIEYFPDSKYYNKAVLNYIKSIHYLANTYAQEVIKGRWHEAEDVILTNINSTFSYIKYLTLNNIQLDKKFIKKCEDVISKDDYYMLQYILNILKKPYKKFENIISCSADDSYYYAEIIIKGRWKKGEDVISKDPYFAYLYAKNVIKGRWKKGEDAINTIKAIKEQYELCLNDFKNPTKKTNKEYKIKGAHIYFTFIDDPIIKK